MIIKQKCKNDSSDKNIYESECPVIYALEIVGQKWKLPILWYLYKKESTRYNELKRKVNGITNMMLTKSLQELEMHQLITRTPYYTVPPRVEYALTPRGQALIPALNALYDWGTDQLDLDKKRKTHLESK
jgi:DNA-binding HxlR family transcriptional regulator